MIEKFLIEHCSPTLASLKTASLFTYSFDSKEDFIKDIDSLNHKLCAKGVSLIILRLQKNTALVYVARFSSLKRDLSKPGIAEFLKTYGYESTDCVYALKRLKQRICAGDGFPHEIGLFLGYPLGDVQGFIENAGAHCKCSGCWKVYCNECEAIKTFARFKKCKSVYSKLFNNGRSVLQLTVAA